MYRFRRLPFVLLAIVALCLVAATVVEKFYGSGYALERVYLSPWMIALWTATAATALAEVLARRRAMGFGSLLLHLSLILVLAGAAVTHFFGEHGRITLSVGAPESRSWILSSGEKATLPFGISLADCGVEYHASAIAARDYFSIVDVEGRESRISMNRVLDCRGYRFTQASLGEGTSTLSVSHDPLGRGLTFAAYALLFISMPVVMVRSRRFCRLVRKAVVPVLILLPSVVVGQPRVIQAPLAASYGRLYAVSGGRVCPVQTVALDFCNKICGKSSYSGFTAEQVLTGWIYYYDDWKREPMIKLKSREARSLVGKNPVALTDLFTRDGYILEPLLRDSVVSRDLLSDDEKVTFISSVVAGRIPSLPGVDRFEAVGMLDDIAADIAVGRYRDANARIAGLREFQEREYGASFPSPVAVRAELLYNAGCYPLCAAVVAFVAGIAGVLGYGRFSLAVGIAVLLYLTYIIVLRWIVGGHIPLATGYETMLSLAWFAVFAAVVCAWRIPSVLPLGLLVGGAALMVAMMGYRNPSVSPLMPVLESRLLSLHVMLVMSSYALFAIIALNSAVCLAGRAGADTSRFLLYPALFLLGAGIFVGAIWADRSWGRYWGWDPKETWALVTFIVYSFPFHDGCFRAFRRDRFLSIYLIIAFLSVLMTYFGVNYLLGGLHSYGAA